MINCLELYKDAGEKAAKAFNENDYTRFNFEKQHFLKMLSLEVEDDKIIAREAYNNSYCATRALRIKYKI